LNIIKSENKMITITRKTSPWILWFTSTWKTSRCICANGIHITSSV